MNETACDDLNAGRGDSPACICLGAQRVSDIDKQLANVEL